LIPLNDIIRTCIQKKRSMSQLIVRAGEFTFQVRFEEHLALRFEGK
jgi:hypothetical protein